MSHTDLVYLEDAYCVDFDATVIGVEAELGRRLSPRGPARTGAGHASSFATR